MTIERLHDDVDRAAAPVAEANAARMQCRRGCFDCCVDGITVFEVEAERIRREAASLLATAQPHPPGRCAFLGSEGECRIYAARPYVCRTQGLPLRWIDDEAEYRDICTLNDEGAPIETLPEEQCWTIGPVEERLARMQRDGRRVGLRELWSLP